MTSLRKARGASSDSLPPEAFDYDTDVTKELVRSVQERAKKARRDDEFDVIEGYVGQLRK